MLSSETGLVRCCSSGDWWFHLWPGASECRRLSTTSQSFQYLEEQSCREAFCSGNVLLYRGFSHFDGFGSVYLQKWNMMWLYSRSRTHEHLTWRLFLCLGTLAERAHSKVSWLAGFLNVRQGHFQCVHPLLENWMKTFTSTTQVQFKSYL